MLKASTDPNCKCLRRQIDSHDGNCYDSLCLFHPFPTPLKLTNSPIQKPTSHFSSSSRLMSLPSELRLRIYECLLTGPQSYHYSHNRPSITVTGSKRHERLESPKEMGLTIFSVCRQIYFEARPVFFSINDFDIFEGYDLHGLGYFVQSIGLTNCALVRRINLRTLMMNDRTARLLFAALTQLSGLRKCSLTVSCVVSDKAPRMDELLEGFVKYGSVWLGNHKNVLELKWSNGVRVVGPFPTDMFWDCVERNLERKKAGLNFQNDTSWKDIPTWTPDLSEYF